MKRRPDLTPAYREARRLLHRFTAEHALDLCADHRARQQTTYGIEHWLNVEFEILKYMGAL
jgi:hypothetical protein